MSLTNYLKTNLKMLYTPLIIVLFRMVLVQSNIQTESSVVLIESAGTAAYPESWISDLFYQALANFTVRNVGSTTCQNQGEMYSENLRNSTNWAVKMAESWDRRPIGVLAGNQYHFGIYDECVGVRYPIKAQYCMSEVKLMPVENNDVAHKKENLDRVYNSHAWKTILEWTKYPDQVQRNILNLGICIPNSCTASDLQTSLQRELNKVFLPEKIYAIVNVDQIMCTIREDMYPYNTAFYISCAFFGLLVTICCGTTIYHFVKLSCNQNISKASENFDTFFYSFSFIKSMKELLKYDKHNELNFFNGFKVIMMLFILLGHRFMYLAGSPFVYAITEEDIYSNGPDILITGMNLIDPFFFISGFLLSLSSKFNNSEPVWMKLTIPIINRMLRLLPVCCAMMVITAHIIPHLGDGPLWPKKIWEEADICKNYWWANVLFISNLIDFKFQCLIVSWYLSCDVQLYVIGIIIVYVYTKNTKYGIGLLITVLSLSLTFPIIVTLLTKSDVILKIDIEFLENMRNSTTFVETYRSSYMRGAPFFIGLTMGFVVKKLKKTNFKLSQTAVYGGTFVASVICVGIQLYGVKFYSRQTPYYPIERAVYSVLNHCSWSIIGIWVIICHFTTGYGLLIKLVSNRACAVLGKLSYSVMIVNLTVAIMSQSSQRTSYHFSIKTMVDEWIHDSFKSYLMGLMLYLIVEAPFGKILKKLLERRNKKTSNINGKSEEILKYTETKETDFKLNNF